MGKLGRAEDFRYILKNLPQLEILKIYSPFELHEDGWLKIAKYGNNLKKLHVTNIFEPLTDKTVLTSSLKQALDSFCCTSSRPFVSTLFRGLR